MVARLDLIGYEAVNAFLGWTVIAGLVLACIERVRASDPLWAALAAAVVAVAIVPPAVVRHPKPMIAWEVLALAALPVLARSAGFLVDAAAYLAVATLALAVAVELDAFTAVEMTPDFAVAFVIIVTMAVAAIWTIAQYASDVLLGTSLLIDNATLMWDLVRATGIGVIAGIVFELYFRRISPGHARLWATRRDRG